MKKVTILPIFPFHDARRRAARFGADRGTPAEANAMLQRVVEHYKSIGRKQALADFTAKKAPLGTAISVSSVFGSNPPSLPTAASPKYVGFSADALKDADGKSVS